MWCLSEGTPPINITMMTSSTTLAFGSKGIVLRKINQDGNYSCIATSKFGTESKTFHVSLIGEILLSLLPFECGYFVIKRNKAVAIKR